MIEAIHRAKFGDVPGVGKGEAVKPVVEGEAVQATGKPKFDRVAYQRELMKRGELRRRFGVEVIINQGFTSGLGIIGDV